jgi:hypothetical protein
MGGLLSHNFLLPTNDCSLAMIRYLAVTALDAVDPTPRPPLATMVAQESRIGIGSKNGPTRPFGADDQRRSVLIVLHHGPVAFEV